MFDKLESKYIITGTLKSTSGLYIGGNTNEFEPHAIDNVVIKDLNGMPFIPGSSLKGVMRSYLEKVLKGIGRDVCMVPDLCSNKYNTKEKRNRVKEENNLNDTLSLSQYMYNHLCEICHLFGSEVSAAKLLVRDLKVIESSFNGFEFRTGNSIDRDKNKAIKGALYDIEIIPADTKFDMKLILENPDNTDLKNTAFLIKSMEEGELTIGGNISRGLGGFIAEDIKIQKIDKNNIFNSLVNGEKEYIELENLLVEKEA